MVAATSDPYAALNMPHSASALEIKRAYRTLARKYHPDRLVASGIEDEKSRNEASAQFAKCAAAYALLSDPERKAEYDHIYKYGGFDNSDNDKPGTQRHSAKRRKDDFMDGRNSKLKSMGVGYTCFDPCASLWTQGRIGTRRTVAGIQVPSKIHKSSMASTSGFGVLFTSGHVVNSPSTGTTKCVSETTKYYPLEKRVHTVTETVIFHSNGQKEVVIEEGDGDGRQFSTYNSTPTDNRQRINHELPWYVHAWNQLHDKLSMCYNPCAVLAARD
jgi:DnaJ domain